MAVEDHGTASCKGGDADGLARHALPFPKSTGNLAKPLV